MKRLRQAIPWRTPSELVQLGFERSRVVMMNEAHHGLSRCVRTRQVGQQILPAAHEGGCRYLAMEALHPPFTEQANTSRQLPAAPATTGYLGQPEMQAFIQAALDLGWTLIEYEADLGGLLKERFDIDLDLSAEMTEATRRKLEAVSAFTMSMEVTNWREEQQARRLNDALVWLPAGSKMLVWCGNGHLNIRPSDGWTPMGWWFGSLSGQAAFSIDQTATVEFPMRASRRDEWLPFRDELLQRGGTAGVLVKDVPDPYRQMAQHSGVDALLLSVDNALV